ncbi:MAG TPA: aldehyde dehydrogenase family protein, partial [Rhodanobacteraceae bacterium]
MLNKRYPYYLANKAVQANTELAVLDKYSGKVATRVAMPDARTIEKAIRAAVKAEAPMRNFKPWQRQAVLNHCVTRMSERKKELAEALCIEAGKPIHDAEGEVSRLIDTFRIAAELAPQVGGEVL